MGPPAVGLVVRRLWHGGGAKATPSRPARPWGGSDRHVAAVVVLGLDAGFLVFLLEVVVVLVVGGGAVVVRLLLVLIIVGRGAGIFPGDVAGDLRAGACDAAAVSRAPSAIVSASLPWRSMSWSACSTARPAPALRSLSMCRSLSRGPDCPDRGDERGEGRSGSVVGRIWRNGGAGPPSVAWRRGISGGWRRREGGRRPRGFPTRRRG